MYTFSISNRIVKFPGVLNILVLLLLCSCKTIDKTGYLKPAFVDNKASTHVINLHEKLFLISQNGFAIGHQDATAYGIGWKHWDNPNLIKSDVHEVVQDFPAVYGFDIGRIEHALDKNLDSVPFELMKNLIIEGYKNGGIITISWHVDNPVSGGDSWDPTSAVSNILVGGNQREKYELWISRVAEFLKSLQYNGEEIPIIFRPFHEMNGSWFWWGGNNCEPSDYIALWQETIKLLRDKHQIHNLLYAYSPNKLNPSDEYLKYYPGDAYVDILGIDIYDFKNSDEYVKSVVSDLNKVKRIATDKNKLFAFTETGLEAIPTENWYSEILYPALENSGVCWVLFWRNYSTKHHYMPFKGHVSEADFKQFKALPKTLFLKDIKKIKK